MTAQGRTNDAQPTAPSRDLVLSDKELQEVEAVCEAATEGPWWAANSKTGRRGSSLVGVASMRGQGEAGCIAVLSGGGDLWRKRNDDADFIVAARTALPQLLSEVRRLRSQEQRIRAACEGFSSVRVSVIQQAIDGEK